MSWGTTRQAGRSWRRFRQSQISLMPSPPVKFADYFDWLRPDARQDQLQVLLRDVERGCEIEPCFLAVWRAVAGGMPLEFQRRGVNIIGEVGQVDVAGLHITLPFSSTP